MSVSTNINNNTDHYTIPIQTYISDRFFIGFHEKLITSVINLRSCEGGHLNVLRFKFTQITR